MRQSTRGWAHEAPPIEQDRSRWHPELTGLGPLTPDDVRNVAFTKPPLGKRGYNEDQVDAFLDRVEAALRDPAAANMLTPDDVRNVAFTKPPLGKRGYNEDQVDAFLDRVEDTLKRRETRENT
ncbi:cell division protein DivIVA [Mycobacterium heckeshornense]|nr:DivIVA domain-containing protein [Mycobacterium heckeshornense]PIJ37133.1 cell division protein DivIVA [Mycobacterium heckeshornense]